MLDNGSRDSHAMDRGTHNARARAQDNSQAVEILENARETRVIEIAKTSSRDDRAETRMHKAVDARALMAI